MTIINIISAIGNNNSVYPLLLRDCGIEVPTKVYLTYKQNQSDKDIAMLATRERFVDEYTVSAVWLGGIPLLERIGSKVLKKNGFNPEISSKLLKEETGQGLEYNIKKFKDIAPEAVKDLEFIKQNKAKYKKLLGGKMLAETVIPIALMGFVIPKLIFAWTASTKKKLAQKKEEALNKQKNNEIVFKGSPLSNLANMSTVQKMALTDGGYAVGRIATARNRDAGYDVGVKMAGMMFLNFVFPSILAKFLDKTSGKIINTNLNLDIKMLDDKEFIDAIKNKKLDIPKITDGKELLEYVDKNPNSSFTKFANKYNKVKTLSNGVRDPRKYVRLENLKAFRDNISEISDNALKSGDVERFMKKARNIKGANILANVAISSFLLAYALPKFQFAFRKKFLGMELEPGIAE